MPIFVVPRQLVYPGDLVATSDVPVLGPVYVEDGRVRSMVIGLAEVKEDGVNIIPLEGVYRPRRGDVVIGIISGVGLTGWEVDIRAPYVGYLPVHEAVVKHVDVDAVELSTIMGIGDTIVAKILEFDLSRENPVVLTIKEAGLGKVESGTLVEISPVKIPRVIGKKGSMISLLKSELKCELVVSQNGRVVVKCEDSADESFVAFLIRKIEREAHTTGLTDRITQLIRDYKSRREKSR